MSIEDEINSAVAEWKIQTKLFSIILDNVSTNDCEVDLLKIRLNGMGLLPCDGDFFHIPCCTHILNLIVKSAFDIMLVTIKKLCDGIKYVKQSAHRKKNSVALANNMNVDTSKKLVLDCPTRWNSIYNMLIVALRYKSVFLKFGERDSKFNLFTLSEKEWTHIGDLCNFLKIVL